MNRFRGKIAILLVFALAFSSLLGGIGFANDDSSGQINRVNIDGGDRYSTSVQIANEQFSASNVNTVILANGDHNGDSDSAYSDALASSVLAGAANAPILLTADNALPEITAQAIADFEPSTVYVLGGELAISEDVVEEVEAFGADVERVNVDGGDRISTAIEIAKLVNDNYNADLSTAYIVDAWVTVDSMVAGAASVENGNPIIPVDTRADAEEAIDGELVNTLQDIGVEEFIIVGGTLAVSDEIKEQLEESFDFVDRISGGTGTGREGTSVAFAEQGHDDITAVSLVNGFTDHVDAVSAAVYGAPILYVEQGEVPTIVADYIEELLEENNELDFNVFGGTLAIGSSVIGQIEEIISDVTPETLVVSSADAVSAQKVQVNFSLPVEETDEAEFDLRRGNVNVSHEVSWNIHGDVATLETSNNLQRGDYTVTVNGLDIPEGFNEASFFVAEERVDHFDTLGDNVFRLAVPEGLTNGTVQYIVYNQYGEDITEDISHEDISVGSSVGEAWTVDEGTIQFSGLSEGVDSLNLTLTDSDSGVSTTKTLSIVDPQAIAEVSVGEPQPHEDDEVLKSEETYVLPLEATDQYGTPVDIDEFNFNQMTIISSDRDVFDPATAAEFDDDEGEVVVTFEEFDGAQDVRITVIANYDGSRDFVDLTVHGDAIPDTPELVAPSEVFADGDEDFKVELKVYDIFGEEMSAEDINNANLTIIASNDDVFVANGNVTQEDDKVYVLLNGEGKGTANLTVTVNETGNSDTIAIEVDEERRPDGITLTPDYTHAVENAEITLTAEFVDQYGQEVDGGSDVVEVEVDNDNFGTPETSYTIDNLVDEGVTFTASNWDVSTEVTVTLLDADDEDVDSKELTLTAVAEDADLTYEVNEIGTIYAYAGFDNDLDVESAYAQEIEAHAVTSNGDKVALAGNPVVDATSSNTDVADAAQNDDDDWVVYGSNTDEDDLQSGNVTLSVVIGSISGTEVATQTVTVSDEAPEAESVEAKNTDDLTAGSYSLDDLLDGEEFHFEVKDQYGTSVLTNDEYVTVYVYNSEGTSELSGTDDRPLESGDVLTAVTSNGLSVSVTVN